jgi:AmmeMemoRadiSam system protein B
MVPEDTGRPTLETIRGEMSIPSRGLDQRGQRDGVGFATSAEQMERIWELADLPPSPEIFSPAVGTELLGAICPHDDYLYAGRVYKRVLPAVRAKTVVLVGVFHGYRRFGARDRLVFDPYRVWRAPDGDLSISPLRDAWAAALPENAMYRDAAMHDAEHSVEALAYWLRHQRKDLELVPVLVPPMSWTRLTDLAATAGTALAGRMRERGWSLGKDVAVVISADAIHYGRDFAHTPFGEGGLVAYEKAVARDREILTHVLGGSVTTERVRALYETFVHPEEPERYRVTWCGRFSIPFGMLLLENAARALGHGRGGRDASSSGGAAAHAKTSVRSGHSTNAAPAEDPTPDADTGQAGNGIRDGNRLAGERHVSGENIRPAVKAVPVAYATSVGWPELPGRDVGLGVTAPADLDHFVGYPGVALLS